MTRLSVIIPVYNAQDYLRQCLDSILSQSLKDIEVICVDDGSEDNSLEILQEYASKDTRVRILHQTNQYAGAARNKGLSVASGEYVTFMDADDYVLDYAYESLYRRASAYRLDWIKCRSIAYDMSRKVTVDNPNYLFGMVKAKDYNRLLTPDDEGPAYRISVVPWNGIYKRSFLEEYHICFNSLICINDRSFYWRVLTNAKRFMLSRDYLVVHRVGQKGSLVGKRAENFDCQFRSFEIIAKHLEDDRIPEEKALHVMKRELVDLRTWYQRFCRNPLHSGRIKRITKEFVEGYNGAYSNLLKETYREQMDQVTEDVTSSKDRPALSFFREECHNPKVSVIIPVYNVEDYLHECLDSVCGQTLEDIEIICVDDGSTDASGVILREYAAIDGRIRILEQMNLYAGAARNAGIRIARGEYLLFLDSDDFFDSRLCELTYNEAKLQNADMVLFGAKIYDMSIQECVKSSSFFRMDMLPDSPVFSWRDVPDELFLLTTPNPWLKLFRREFVLQEGLLFQEIRHSNDIYFSLVAMAAAKRITSVRESLVCYRKGRAENLQSTKDDNPTLFLDAYEKVRMELLSRGIYHELEKGFVERFLSSCVHNLNTVNTDLAWAKIYETMYDSEIVREGALDKSIEEYRFPDNVRRILVGKKIMDCCRFSVQAVFETELKPKELYDYVIAELDADWAQRRKLQYRVNYANQKINAQENEIRDIKESIAFRFGKIVVWLPKKFSKIFLSFFRKA